ncbi:MAG: hypothetical protein ACKO5E_06910 [bacterium]
MSASFAPAVSDLYQARANLDLFRDLALGQKLEYDRQSGKFTTYSGNGFGRTMGNLFKGQNNLQSVRNDELFKTPIVETFQKLLNFVDVDELAAGRAGLEVLRQTYERDRNQAKQEKLAETLSAVDTVIASRDSTTASRFRMIGDLLKHYYQAGDARVQQFTKNDIRMISAVFQNDRLMRASESRVYNDDNKGGVGRMRELIYDMITEIEGVGQIEALMGRQFRQWYDSLPRPAGYEIYAQDRNRHDQFMALLNNPSDPRPRNYNSFLWFKPASNLRMDATYRFYLCPDMLEINKLINALVTIFAGEKISKLSGFKIQMDFDMQFKRRERVVVYLSATCTEAEAVEFARQIKSRAGGILQPDGRVLGSREVAPNIFMLLEPGNLSLGMYENDRTGKINNFNQTQQSANSLRAELLTMAYINWRSDYSFRNGGDGCDFSSMARNTRDKEFFIFLKYVTAAFLSDNPQLNGTDMQNAGQLGDLPIQRRQHNRVA